MAILFAPPFFRATDISGQPIPGAFLAFYATGSSTLQPIYADVGLTVALANPLQSDGNGWFPAIWLNDSLPQYKYVYSAPDVNTPTIPGVVLRTGDPYNANIGEVPITARETAVGVLPANTNFEELDPRRYASISDWSLVYNSISTLANSYPGWYRGDHAQHPSLTNCIIGAESYDDSQKTGTIGYRCTAMGVLAMQQNKNSVSAGGSNTAVGFASQQTNVEGSGNCSFGALTLSAVTGLSSSHNNAFGYRGQSALITGTQNNTFGFQVLTNLLTGNNNHAFGESALTTMTGGNGNHAFGYQALYSKVTGDNTHAFGYQCLFNETTGAANTAFGYQAGLNIQTKSNNVILGFQAASSAAVGDNNVVIGFQAGLAMSNSDLNVLNGYQAGLRITSGGSNTISGQQAGNNITTGSENVVSGANAGQGISTSVRGCFYGSISGVNLNGNNNTGVGYNAGSVASAQTYTNTGCFGANSVPTGSNQIVLGDPNIAAIRAQVTTITALSDKRFKDHIETLDIPVEFLEEVRIVAFDWNERLAPRGRQVGIIAQELDALQTKYGLEWLGLVDKSNPDRWEATPGKLLFPLIQRVQQQEARLKAIEARLGMR